MARRRNKVDPALAVEAAFRQEILGQKGVYFGSYVMSSDELRRMGSPPMFPLYPFNILDYYRVD
jgi:hypothetical protein